MSTNHTTNYNLNQWEATDKVLRTEFNEDNAKIDAALKANADGIAANAAELAEHAAALLSKGNCQLYTGSYVGTGAFGSENPNILTFPHKPFLVIIYGNPIIFGLQGASSGIVVQGFNFGYSCSLQWSENTLTWWSSYDAQHQANQKNVTYQVYALLDAVQ